MGARATMLAAIGGLAALGLGVWLFLRRRRDAVDDVSSPEVLYTGPVRTADAWKAALDRFDVEHNPRYVKNQLGMGETWCNRFAADTSQEMGCPLPQGVVVNEQLAWLTDGRGAAAGWSECGTIDGFAHADAGEPTYVVIYEEPHGHIAAVRETGRIAQAGATNYADASIAREPKLVLLGRYFFHP